MLIPDWRNVLKKAWSVRLMAAASVLSGAEAALPLFSGVLPRGTFAVLLFFVVTGALLSRFLAQKELHDDE